MEITDRRGLHVTHCNTSLGLPRANAPAVPSVFRNTPPADAQDESLRTAPEDWRAQPAEQKAAINQYHIARIAEHFRQTGARVKQHAEDLPLDPRLANYIIEGTRDGLVADLDRKWAEGAAPLEIINGPPAGGAPMHTFRFGRQRREDGLCLSDYVLEGDLCRLFFRSALSHAPVGLRTVGRPVQPAHAKAPIGRG